MTDLSPSLVLTKYIFRLRETGDSVGGAATDIIFSISIAWEIVNTQLISRLNIIGRFCADRVSTS